MKEYHVYDINYDVTEEDVTDLVYDEYDCDSIAGSNYDSAFENECEKKIAEIKSELPSEMTIAIEDDGRDIDEQLCDIISDKTGFLIDSFEFEEV